MKDSILIAWLICDVTASVLLFAGCAYVVFWRGYSGFWFVAAFILACSFGGDKLYRRLNERTAAEKQDATPEAK